VEDRKIIELYFKRNERAIEETQHKYGAYCFQIARNILSAQEDAEECVNDVWHITWNKIPPTIPISFKAFLGKLVRDISLSRYRANHAKKRYQGLEAMLDELEECIPSGFDTEKNYENQLITEAINQWLESLPKEERVLFVKRYYYGASVKDLAMEFGYRENQMAQKMMKLRKKLRVFLIREGVDL
jgi:RNA polymerase sigma factor, sigma-70 family